MGRGGGCPKIIDEMLSALGPPPLCLHSQRAPNYGGDYFPYFVNAPILISFQILATPPPPEKSPLPIANRSNLFKERFILHWCIPEQQHL
jgi:hypothetical protein